jgi:hypothetical protein
MLSDTIDALRESLEKFADTGAVFEPTAIREIGAVLAFIGDDARRLEAVLDRARALPPDDIVPPPPGDAT